MLIQHILRFIPEISGNNQVRKRVRAVLKVNLSKGREYVEYKGIKEGHAFRYTHYYAFWFLK